jgi:hypothetical protein
MTNTRINIVGDMDPSEPYDDGGSPLFRISYSSFGTGWSVEQVQNVTSYKAYADLIQAIGSCLRRWSGQEELRDRYLSIWFGVTAVETWHSGQCLYLTCDPADWREKVGAQPGSISLAEWQAYCLGDVYGVVPEEEVEWRSGKGETKTIWESDGSLDGCWGFYGIQAAREYAEEMFPGVPVVEGGA